MTPQELAALQQRPQMPIDPAQSQQMIAPPLPTPASAGFAAWAADPQNTSKVANSIVKPGQSIIPPNAATSMLQANQQPTQSPADPASPPPYVAPPPPVQQSADVTGAPTFPSYNDWASKNPQSLATPNWKHQAGGGVGGALKDAAGLGVAGLLGATGWYRGNPGAGVQFAEQQQAYDRSVPDINQARYKAAVIDPLQAGLKAQQVQADIANTQATTAYTGQRAGIAQNKIIQQAASKGLKPVYDESGQLSGWQDDTESQAYKSSQALQEMHAATAEKDAIQSQIQKNHFVPGTPQFEEAQRKLDQVDKRLGVAMAGLGLRAESLQLRKENQAASLYGTDTHGNYLPGTPMIANDEGTEVGVGSKNAGHAIAQQKTVGSFKDLAGSIQNVRSELSALHSEGSSLSDPLVVAALSDPHSMIGKVVNGQLVQGNLSPTQVKAVAAVRQYHEQAGILRSTTGGTASEAGAQRILDTAPGAGDSPETAMEKLSQAEQVLGRLAPGQTRVVGGVSIPGRAHNQGGGDKVVEYVKGADGKYHPKGGR